MNVIFTNWRKSTRSNPAMTCVEVGSAGALVGVRDTKDRHGPVLVFSGPVWESFTGEMKSDDLNMSGCG